MIRIEYRTGREGSTPRLHQNFTVVNSSDLGGEIGSTGWDR